MTRRTASRAGQLGTSQPSTDGPTASASPTRPNGWPSARHAIAAFVKKRGHLFATPPEQLAGAEGTTFWDYQNVPLKVGITDLTGKKVTFTCNNYLQVINLAFAHYLTRTCEFKRRFGRFDPTRVNLVYRSGEEWLKQPREGYIGYRHTELIIAYAP